MAAVVFNFHTINYLLAKLDLIKKDHKKNVQLLAFHLERILTELLVSMKSKKKLFSSYRYLNQIKFETSKITEL